MIKITNKNPAFTIYFDNEKKRHKFYKEDQKTPIYSVTSDSGIIDKSGAMMGWAVNCMAEYLLENWDKYAKEDLVASAKRNYRTVSREAADIGTMIHEWINDYIKGEKPDIPDNEKVSNGIIAFLKWEKDNEVKWLETEKIVYCPILDRAGILDAVANINGIDYIVDFKSSKAIYPEMFIQVGGYHLLYESMTDSKIEKQKIIRLGKENGEFETADSPDVEISKNAYRNAVALRNSMERLCKK